MSQSQLFVGMDVAQAQLDIAVRPTGERWAVTHEEAGITGLVAQLQAVVPALMVLEATGGYQRAVVAALAAAGLPVVIVTPRQARDFAKAPGQLAKTEVLDARAAPLARRADGGAARSAGAAPATHRQADGGAEPPERGVPAPPG